MNEYSLNTIDYNCFGQKMQKRFLFWKTNFIKKQWYATVQ